MGRGRSGGNFTGWPGEACLTAGTDTSQSPIAGCDLGTPDAAGSGTLRLTPATTGRAGFTLHNSALTTAGGLDITFQQAQWGGSGADGISFFLVDGATNLTQPGASGGALGYASGNGITPGVANGLIGVGIDTWGNFSATGRAPGRAARTRRPGQTPNRVVVRGPGNGTVGYCFLGTSGDVGDLDGAIARRSHADGAGRLRPQHRRGPQGDRVPRRRSGRPGPGSRGADRRDVVQVRLQRRDG